MSQDTKIVKKLRILALHGYMQSAEKFKEKSSLPRKFKKLADFEFFSAPFRVPLIDEDIDSTRNDKDQEVLNERPIKSLMQRPVTDITGSFTVKEEPVEHMDYPLYDTNSFAWYLRRPNTTKTGYLYRGVKECVDFIDDLFKEKGPFDGVFGFSQGACVVAMLCALQQKNLTKNIKFDFAIMAGAYTFAADEFYDEQIKIPSLHIYGETDQIVVPERSLQVANCFENPLVISHPGGHFVPCNAAQRKAYGPFFIEQWNKKYGFNN